MMAGIVTNPIDTALKARMTTVSYLEFDDTEMMKIEGRGGVESEDSVLWVERRLDIVGLVHLLKSNQLGIWVEGGGPLRWGTTINLVNVRNDIARFSSGCK